MSAATLSAHRAVFGAQPIEATLAKRYWRLRQDALPTNRIPEALEPHEIEFYEWFLIERGYQAHLIPRDTVNFTPTNDFIWLDNGSLICEVKATSATYAAIKSRIYKAVTKAAAQGVTKNNFIIDVRDQVLTPKVQRQLSRINARADQSPHISRLWVWHQSGFDEITLE